MANYLVTDTDLTAVADAIRTKGGTSASLAFPSGFVDAVEAIETGGGGDVDFGNLAQPTGAINTTATTLGAYMFYGRTGITSFSGPNVNTRSNNAMSAFYGCTSLQSVSLPALTSLYNAASIFQNCRSLASVDLSAIIGFYATNGFAGCFTLQQIVLGKHGVTATHGDQFIIAQGCFTGCTSLEIVDASKAMRIDAKAFDGASLFGQLILRTRDNIVTLGNVNAFTNNPFASGGAGGTIYIPKALYDHLGDGSSLDYKAGTNWSTVDGYGTITWAPIEGSIYETQYADGTPIT